MHSRVGRPIGIGGLIRHVLLGHRADDFSLVVLKGGLRQDLADRVEVVSESSEGMSLAALPIVVERNADALRSDSGKRKCKQLHMCRILDAMNLLDGGKDPALRLPSNKLGAFCCLESLFA
jgi:hypothetical protein